MHGGQTVARRTEKQRQPKKQAQARERGERDLHQARDRARVQLVRELQEENQQAEVEQTKRENIEAAAEGAQPRLSAMQNSEHDQQVQREPLWHRVAREHAPDLSALAATVSAAVERSRLLRMRLGESDAASDRAGGHRR
jgi:hypothetical protein